MNAEIVLAIRLVVGVATILLLARYHEPEARFRLGPSALAGVCMALSAALTVPIVLQWSEEVRSGTQLFLLLISLTMFIPVAWARGDMAKVYDKLTCRRD